MTLRHYLRHYCLMKPNETVGNSQTVETEPQTVARPVHRSAKYQKVMDGRKQPIRGLWERNGRFIARLKVKDHGKKKVRWVPLGDEKNPVTTVPQAVKALHKLQEKRETDALPVLGRTPKFADFVPEYFAEVERLNKLAENPGSTNRPKRESTIAKERGTLELWTAHLGETRLNNIEGEQVETFIRKRQDAGISNRTIMLDIIALRNVLKFAMERKHIRNLPQINVSKLKWKSPTRQLVTAADIETVCSTAFKPLFVESHVAHDGEQGRPLQNAQQFSDYLRLMAYCGSRRDETLRLEWKDVHWDQQQLEIGADGLAKNHKSRVVDFNPNLEAHLRDMYARRQPDSRFLFPSPQRGDQDLHARTFKESLNLAREAAEMPDFNIHDCRHHFISYAVMSGIDFMTIAAWVDHQDGGILIGKTYGHLADAHKKQMAEKLRFSLAVVPMPEAVHS